MDLAKTGIRGADRMPADVAAMSTLAFERCTRLVYVDGGDVCAVELVIAGAARWVRLALHGVTSLALPRIEPSLLLEGLEIVRGGDGFVVRSGEGGLDCSCADVAYVDSGFSEHELEEDGAGERRGVVGLDDDEPE